MACAVLRRPEPSEHTPHLRALPMHVPWTAQVWSGSTTRTVIPVSTVSPGCRALGIIGMGLPACGCKSYLRQPPENMSNPSQPHSPSLSMTSSDRKQGDVACRAMNQSAHPSLPPP